MLERYLVVIFVINNAFNAVGFILTAKTIVRFHDIGEDRKSAEYILIGTLVSTLIAISVGLFVGQLAPVHKS